MTDRIDTSQYPAAYDFRELAPVDFPDGVTVEGQYEGHDPAYASVHELTNYPDHFDTIPDPAIQSPAIVTTITKPTRELRYRGIGGGGAVVYGRNRFAGYSLRETTGAAPAVVRFRDGLDVSGVVVVTVQVPAGLSANVFLTPDTAVPFSVGVFVEVVSGALEGSLFLLGEHRD